MVPNYWRIWVLGISLTTMLLHCFSLIDRDDKSFLFPKQLSLLDFDNKKIIIDTRLYIRVYSSWFVCMRRDAQLYCSNVNYLVLYSIYLSFHLINLP